MRRYKIKNKNLFEIVGKTEDNALVVSGIMRFRESYGLPLSYIFDAIISEGMVVSWRHLVEEALSIGINKDKFLSELKSSILDSFGEEYLSFVWEKIIIWTEKR